MANKLRVDKLLTIDETGMPQAPDIKQLLDKDVQLLWLRDKTKDKSQYIKEVVLSIILQTLKDLVNKRDLVIMKLLKKLLKTSIYLLIINQIY